MKSCVAKSIFSGWSPVWAPKSIDTYWFNDDCYTTNMALCQKKVANDDWKWINCYLNPVDFNASHRDLDLEF